MLHRLLRVRERRRRTAGRPGRVSIEKNHAGNSRRNNPGKPEQYHLITATTLEDRSGNSIERPFELDVFNPIQKTVQPGEVQLPFTVR